MRTLYLECAMGAAGDMLMGALLELHPEPEAFLRRLNGLGLPGVTVTAERAETRGISGTHIHVLVDGQEEHTQDQPAREHTHEHVHAQEHSHTHEHVHVQEHNHAHEHEHTHGQDAVHDHEHTHEHAHAHTGMHDIAHIIGGLDVPEPVRRDALAVYDSIAQAEARAHGKPVTEVHFHEVGAMDAVADVVGVCLLMYELEVEEILASPVHVGAGTVQCAHGILPVPAPATEYLLEGVPTYGGEVQGELCTPTGAALLRYFVQKFGSRPVMTVERTGYGVGSKTFPRANCLRAMLGRTETAEDTETVLELSCNLDDMTAEDMACGMDILREAGALEVYTTAAGMKKGRPGVVLTCICHEAQRDTLVKLMFRHFTTLGIREATLRRYILGRAVESRETSFGPVRYKTASGWGVTREKPELEDLKTIARDTGKSLEELRLLLAREESR